MLRAMGASVVAMVLMLVIGPPFIRWLRLNEFGQSIREEGPAAHKAKEGTPTMGGLAIWIAVLIPFLVFSRLSVASITVLIAAFGNAFIGFIDDWTKIVRKRSDDTKEIQLETQTNMSYRNGTTALSDRFVLHKDGHVMYFNEGESEPLDWSSYQPKWEFTRYPVLPMVVEGVDEAEAAGSAAKRARDD